MLKYLIHKINKNSSFSFAIAAVQVFYNKIYSLFRINYCCPSYTVCRRNDEQ